MVVHDTDKAPDQHSMRDYAKSLVPILLRVSGLSPVPVLPFLSMAMVPHNMMSNFGHQQGKALIFSWGKDHVPATYDETTGEVLSHLRN